MLCSSLARDRRYADMREVLLRSARGTSSARGTLPRAGDAEWQDDSVMRWYA